MDWVYVLNNLLTVVTHTHILYTHTHAPHTHHTHAQTRLQFFISSDVNVPADKLWHSKYSIRTSMVPSFIAMETARKVCQLSLYTIIPCITLVPQATLPCSGSSSIYCNHSFFRIGQFVNLGLNCKLQNCVLVNVFALYTVLVRPLQILITGKSINFLRLRCQDRTPIGEVTARNWTSGDGGEGVGWRRGGAAKVSFCRE